MIETAFIMAVFISIGFGILFHKLPKPIKRFLSRRYILLDIFLCWAVFTTLGFAMVGIMTAAMVSVFVSVWLLWANKPQINERDT